MNNSAIKNFNNASEVCIEEGVCTIKSYIENLKYLREKYSVFLPGKPARFYGNDYKGSHYFLTGIFDMNVATYKQASEICISERFESIEKYILNRERISNKYNLKFPCNVKKHYKSDWIDTSSFLTGSIGYPHATYKEASEICQKENILSLENYKRKKSELEKNYNVKLYSAPRIAYKDEWINSFVFVSGNPEIGLATYDYASSLCKSYGIMNYKQYQKLYKIIGKDNNTKLPSTPRASYESNYTTLKAFLQITRKKSAPESRVQAEYEHVFNTITHTANNLATQYGSISELDIYDEQRSIAIEYDGYYWHRGKYEFDLEKYKKSQSIGISQFNIREKDYRYTLPVISKNTDISYDSGNENLLSMIKRLFKLISKKVVLSKAIQDNIIDYQKSDKFKNPDRYDILITWASFELASEVCQKEKVTSEKDYIKKRRTLEEKYNVSLPSHPERIYKEDWISFPHFLTGKTSYPRASYHEALGICLENNIKTRKEYIEKYKYIGDRNALSLPGKPYAYYGDYWVDFPNFLSGEITEKLYKGFSVKSRVNPMATYSQAMSICRDNNICTRKEYKNNLHEINKNNKIRLPANPQRVFIDDWVDFKTFFLFNDRQEQTKGKNVF